MTLSSGSSATEDSVRSLLLLYSVCDACEFEDKGGPWERSILLPARCRGCRCRLGRESRAGGVRLGAFGVSGMAESVRAVTGVTGVSYHVISSDYCITSSPYYPNRFFKYYY